MAILFIDQVRHDHTLLLLTFIFLLGNTTFAQFDSTYTNFKNARLNYINSSQMLQDSLAWNQIDTSFVSIYKEGTQTIGYHVDLGNVGSAQTSLLFSDWRRDLFFTSSVFQSNLFLSSNTKYYHVSAPLTRITFFTGSKKEQGAGFTHTQNVNKQLNFAIDFNRFSSEGYFINQKTVRSSFGISSNYVSKNRMYKAFANWNLNIGSVQENGGMVSDSAFVNNEEDNRFSIPVNLTEANNDYDVRDVSLMQVLDLFSSVKDTNGTKRSIVPSLFVSNTLRWNYNRFTDDDPDSTYYENLISYDTFNYEDAIKAIQFENTAGFIFNTKWGINPVIQVNHNISDYEDDGLDTNFTSTSYTLKLPHVQLSRFHVSADFTGGIDGFNNEQFSYNLKIGTRTISDIDLSVFSNYSSSLPHFSLLYYNSDNDYLTWSNDHFKNEERTSIGLALSSLKHHFNVVAKTSSLNNYTYINSSNLPEQSGTLQVLHVEVNKRFNLKPIVLDVSAVYQTSDDETVLSLPELSTSSSLYYENSLFKKAMRIRVGGRLRYYTSYYAQGYFALSRQFYNQNEVELGEYPYVDVFLKAKIKRAQIFVELSNAGQGIFDYEYIMIPGYPQRDRNLRFGVQWDFMN